MKINTGFQYEPVYQTALNTDGNISVVLKVTIVSVQP